MQTKEELIRRLFLNQCSRKELELLLRLIEEDRAATAPQVMTELFRQMGPVPEMDADVSDRIFSKVEKGLEEAPAGSGRKMIGLESARRKRLWRLGSAAAAVLLLIGSLWVLPHFTAPKENLEQTAYDEVKELVLPDSSLVVLNGNSSISYVAPWPAGATRVVRLQGEAYFKVREKPATQTKFQVLTNDLTVEVLGTAFNVNTHENETRVFLEEGEVKVNLEHAPDNALYLAPGEAMRYSARDKKLNLPEKIIQEQQPNWRAGFQQFTETPLEMILTALSQAHKLEFEILDTVLAKMEFDLTLPTEDMEETMGVLRKSTGASIYKDGSRYIIDAAPNKKE